VSDRSPDKELPPNRTTRRRLESETIAHSLREGGLPAGLRDIQFVWADASVHSKTGAAAMTALRQVTMAATRLELRGNCWTMAREDRDDG